MKRVDIPYPSNLVPTLAKSTIFQNLDAQILYDISKECKIYTYHKNEIITRAGTRLPGIYIIESGLVTMYYNKGGSDQIASLSIGRGKCFGLSAMIPDSIALAESVAASTTKILFLSTETLVNYIYQHPALAIALYSIAYNQIKWLLDRISCVKTRTIEARLATWIMQQPKVIVPNINAPHTAVDIMTTKTHLAKQLGVRIQTLSRTLATMRDKGIIDVQGRRIMIINQDNLESYISDREITKYKSSAA